MFCFCKAFFFVFLWIANQVPATLNAGEGAYMNRDTITNLTGRSSDLTIFADHIANDQGGITGETILRNSLRRGVTTKNGVLLKMTFNPVHRVSVKHRYRTEGSIISTCALPDENNADKLFLIAERNGTLRLEVIDSKSEYTYEGGRYDDASMMTTTAFSDPRSDDKQTPIQPFQLCLGEEMPPSALRVGMSAKDYSKMNPVDRVKPLHAGWHDLVSSGGWTWVPELSIEVRGNLGASILAVQGWASGDFDTKNSLLLRRLFCFLGLNRVNRAESSPFRLQGERKRCLRLFDRNQCDRGCARNDQRPPGY